ncbi:hypothetical protein FT663_01399 [Candidozyma haemuli var. vulneris]|nr:hypothetical protein FT662_01080 [[Candida] haemuloni var. vulneris]KAF3994486.1 hypothetical protein FT663_01399 [[Candida] haemuloni var. vulneris]
MKSILPKPSSSVSTPSPSMSNKRKSVPTDYSSSKRRSTSSPPPSGLSKPSSLDKMAQSQASKQSRPVTSCTFCRQHKIKCNASENYPNPCTRCSKMGLKCEIDPQFKPKKGSQIQMLIGDVEELKSKIEMLSKNEHLLTQALNQHNHFMSHSSTSPTYPSSARPPLSARTLSGHNTPNSAIDQFAGGHFTPPAPPSGPSSVPATHTGFHQPSNSINDATGSGQAITNLSSVLQANSTDNSPATFASDTQGNYTQSPEDHQATQTETYSEFILGDVRLSLEKADELHDRFMTKFLPFLPILTSSSATELYSKSQLLFWTVMLTASLSEPEPGLYMSLATLIKQLAIETCWIRTPRSTHVVQALIILAVWPLPNEKVLDDASYRFVGLAKNLSLQLGLHRGGEFISEFSRTQVNLGPNSDVWRTRSWLAVFFCDQFWSSALGLPPSINTTDYLLENARVDQSLPANFRCLISLSIFQCKLVNVMGISVTRSDGLLEPSNRAASLNILDRELERLKFKLNIMEGSAIEMYYLYLRLMICCFAFLPGTPIEDQVKYVSTAYLSATRIITIASQLVSVNYISLIELPIYVRQAITYSAFILFKLHLSRYLIEKYVDSARQSIVTVHRLFRNTLSSWKDLQNDLSRTAKVLENLNIVLYTYPEIFYDDESTSTEGSIISRMRSHLTASLFYDLVWSIHEARRRTLQNKENGDSDEPKIKIKEEEGAKKPLALPFYNQITKDDFKAMTTTTPNGTTITTLVPTDQALNQAKLESDNGSKKPMEINGIPLAMLEATGSTKDVDSIRFSGFDQDKSMRHDVSSEPVERVGFTADLTHGTDFSLESQNQHQQQHQSSAISSDPTQQQIESQEVISQQNTPAYDGSLNSGDVRVSGAGYPYNNGMGSAGMADQLDNFFQQQSHGWLNNNHQDDDFLGWIDVNMLPEK